MSFKLTIDDKVVDADAGQTLFAVAKNAGIEIPALCHFDGLGDVGACRLCLVEIEGSPKLFPACTTPAAANQKVRTTSERLKRYRRMTLELFFSERNHTCAVCVANYNCELQKLAAACGMDSVRFRRLDQACALDASHPELVMDHSRCIMCTRCVRVCDEVEGA
ncbi:MAG: (2Fe-2S)-binding protein, partial [Elusimicrobia bacterium]|nr:(2Fe-2S)-binding protein [Elusimicrobiota bacterium]